MLRQIKYLILLSLFLPISTKAQSTYSVEGYVFDDQTGLPLNDIYVECNTSTKSLITGLSGRFRFDSLEKGQHKLKFIDQNKRNLNTDSTIYLTNDTVLKFYVMMPTNWVRACSYYREMAYKNVKEEKHITLYAVNLSSAIQENDIDFQNKYHVKYEKNHDGCMSRPVECMRTSNKIIAEYLTKKYGKRWKKKVRKDVLF